MMPGLFLIRIGSLMTWKSVRGKGWLADSAQMRHPLRSGSDLWQFIFEIGADDGKQRDVLIQHSYFEIYSRQINVPF